MKDTPTLTPHMRQCVNDTCAFRFPVTEFDKNYTTCPKCGALTQKRVEFTKQTIEHQDLIPERRISLVLDNLRSVFNVGSIFRSSDGCGIVEHLYLCGTTPTPAHPKMAKTALGAEKVIPWSYHPNGYFLTQELLKMNKVLTALEMTATSISLHSFKNNNHAKEIVFIVGNEVTGIDPEILLIVPEAVHLPMQGIKESLNVAIAASILCYSL